jgi:hypothetical protein
MRLLLTSAGIENKSIENALVSLLGKPAAGFESTGHHTFTAEQSLRVDGAPLPRDAAHNT